MTSSNDSILRIFQVVPSSVRWIGTSFGVVSKWPKGNAQIVVTYSKSTKWRGTTYLEEFVTSTVKAEVSKAFATEYTCASNITRFFFQKGKEKNGSHENRGFALEPLKRTPNSLLGKLPPNMKVFTIFENIAFGDDQLLQIWNTSITKKCWSTFHTNHEWTR